MLVTGGAGGIGSSIVRRLLAHGWSVAVADRHSTNFSDLESDGALCFAFDAADQESVVDMVKSAGVALGGLDALVNGAGLLVPEGLHEVTSEGWEGSFSVNARAPFIAIQESVSLLSESNAPSIVNIASIAGRAVASRFTAYAASKAALISITRQSALALSGQGIRVNAVCPGVIDTQFNSPIDQKYGVGSGLRPGQLLEKVAANVPLGRMGRPEEVASLVHYLASEESSFITGQAINVDGGVDLA